jgi:hypothetical protein
MRQFNKLFVIALPRCATVSISQALGLMGIKTAHLGSIYGESDNAHHELGRLERLAQQVEMGDWDLDILRHCQGLADYPVCCMPAIQVLDRQYPGSLFINVRRDDSVDRWLQSVEVHFVGCDLLLEDPATSDDQRQLIRILQKFRAMTFGQERFNAQWYQAAYLKYQQDIQNYFRQRDDLLEFPDPGILKSEGVERLAAFLHMDCFPIIDFPQSNQHSRLPQKAYAEALSHGKILSQTGVAAADPIDPAVDPLL